MKLLCSINYGWYQSKQAIIRWVGLLPLFIGFEIKQTIFIIVQHLLAHHFNSETRVKLNVKTSKQTNPKHTQILLRLTISVI